MDPIVTLDGFTLNTPDDNGYGYLLDVDGIAGWYGSAGRRPNYAGRPYAPGSYFSPAFGDARTVAFTGTLVCKDAATLLVQQRKLSAICQDPYRLYPLTVQDDSGTLAASVQRSTAVQIKPMSPVSAAFTFSLTAPDPRLLGPTRTVSTPMAQSSGAGIPWRGADGLSGIQWRGSDGLSGILWRGVGTVITSGVVLLDNSDGTAPADIVITLRGPAQNPSVSTSTRWLTYNGNLGTNDVLVIDTGSGSVLLNGVNRRPYLTKAQFFQVPTESSLDVRFTAEVQNASAQMTCAWQPSYA